ncbi:MAG: tetratricopeptide repeat protein [Candidatus Zixiibacteriota bacterium]
MITGYGKAIALSSRELIMRVFSLIPVVFVVFAASLALANDKNNPDTIQIDGHLHTGAEIFGIADESSLTFNIYPLSDSECVALRDSMRGPVMTDVVRVDTTSAGWTLVKYTLKDSAYRVFERAERCYADKKYVDALVLYHYVYQLEPSYSQCLTLIGNTHYALAQYDSAIRYFEEETSRNAIDYQAHWFLGDALWMVGDSARAIRELTVAHVLNRNHTGILESLKWYREAVHRNWREWDYIPTYSLSRKDNTITIRVCSPWIGYALVKAIWKYEPRYAERMDPQADTSHLFNSLEEKEALVSALPLIDAITPITSIIEAGDIAGFLYYEVMAPKAPDAVWLLPGDVMNSMVDYVEKYH